MKETIQNRVAKCQLADSLCLLSIIAKGFKLDHQASILASIVRQLLENYNRRHFKKMLACLPKLHVTTQHVNISPHMLRTNVIEMLVEVEIQDKKN